MMIIRADKLLVMQPHDICVSLRDGVSLWYIAGMVREGRGSFASVLELRFLHKPIDMMLLNLQKFFTLYLKFNSKITVVFCSCHDSNAVVACAEFRNDSVINQYLNCPIQVSFVIYSYLSLLVLLCELLVFYLRGSGVWNNLFVMQPCGIWVWCDEWCYWGVAFH